MSYRGARLLVVPALFLVGLRAAAADEPEGGIPIPPPVKMTKPASLSFEQLRDGMKRSATGLWALEVEYVQTAVRGKSEQVPVSLMRYRFACKGEKRMKSQWVGTGSEADLMLAFDGRQGQHYLPQPSRATLTKQKDDFGDVDAYAKMIGMAITDTERANASRNDFLLPAALDRTELQWSVLPELETVEGAECHVLRSRTKGHRIWVDPRMGFAVCYRELLAPVANTPPGEWPRLVTALFSDFVQVSADTWLPKRIRSATYLGSQVPKNLWNKIAYWSDIKVTKLNVAEKVDDAVFQLPFRPGTTVFDAVRNRTYRVGDANEELDMATTQGRIVLSKNKISHWRLIWMVLNVVILGGLIALVVYRRVRRASRA